MKVEKFPMNNSKFQYWFFIIFTIFYFIVLNKFFGITLDKVKGLEANALGDFLAGTFSPLAFLFLILGYLQTNKSLCQNTEAISQQAIAIQQQAESLKQQAKSLDTQVAELKLANEAYKRQVDEMEKSVEAQQNMFELAEKKYLTTLQDKKNSLVPQLILIGSAYSEGKSSLYNGDYVFKFTLRLEVQNMPIKNVTLTNNYWQIRKTHGTVNKDNKLTVSHINLDNPAVLNFVAETNIVPFSNNFLFIDYYDLMDVKYSKKYKITKNSDDHIQFIEIALDN